MENLPKTKKPRVVPDFTLDHTGCWGVVSSKTFGDSSDSSDSKRARAHDWNSFRFL